ncbi:MAG: hypothetical protein PVH45_04650, partial [Candidatus Omnitrophota bacterium]
MNPKKPLYKIISIAITFVFLFMQTAPADDTQYIPFNDNQTTSQYLASEQLQRFSDIKTTLVEQHNASSSPPLLTE